MNRWHRLDCHNGHYMTIIKYLDTKLDYTTWFKFEIVDKFENGQVLPL